MPITVLLTTLVYKTTKWNCSQFTVKIITRFKHLSYMRLQARLISNNKQDKKNTGVNCALGASKNRRSVLWQASVISLSSLMSLSQNLSLSKNSFKKQMKTSLFQILDNEDSYLDVKNISSKLKDCTIKTNWSNYSNYSNNSLVQLLMYLPVILLFLLNSTMSNSSVFISLLNVVTKVYWWLTCLK